MANCQKCAHQWTWTESIKSMFRLRCPDCGAKQYQSAKSKKKSSVISIVPGTLIFLMNIFLSLTLSVGLVVLLFLLAVMLASYPFFLQLSNEEEFWF